MPPQMKAWRAREVFASSSGVMVYRFASSCDSDGSGGVVPSCDDGAKMMMLKSVRTSVFGGCAAALAARSVTSPSAKACCASRQK
eukprot:5373216-Prymnesium_polylepis.2